MSALYDVYIGEHNRTYLVIPFYYPKRYIEDIAKKRFKKSLSKIVIAKAWTIQDDLYLNFPKNSGVSPLDCSPVWVAYIKRNIRRSTYGD